MTVTLDVMLFSYMERPIFDAKLNGQLGLTSFGYPNTGSGTMSGVRIPLGAQKVTWRWADSGETVVARNTPELNGVPKNANFLCIHIYPDETVELALSEHFPRPSPRGEVELETLKVKHGK